jgi:hypothetical protein
MNSGFNSSAPLYHSLPQDDPFLQELRVSNERSQLHPDLIIKSTVDSKVTFKRKKRQAVASGGNMIATQNS